MMGPDYPGPWSGTARFCHLAGLAGGRKRMSMPAPLALQSEYTRPYPPKPPFNVESKQGGVVRLP